ncbi:DUF6544 family protein [Chitinophaga sp.]|uniref:DUF6544 family protein n=1 Tax=Chitinophaga sp. TaxID=1869181 RepID=UPI0031E13A53
MTPLLKRYLAEVKSESRHCINQQKDIITEADIAHLPAPVQEYFHVCRYVGREKKMCAHIEWKEMWIKMSPKQKWITLQGMQFNGVTAPSRIVYMRAKVAGFYALEARDKFQEGHGNMLIKLLRYFTMTDAKGPEMDVSALVTVLSESLLVPAYALQPYIKWTQVNDRAAAATLTHKGLTVNGVFHFNDKGEAIRFETDDRYQSGKHGSFKKLKWFATISEYIEKDGRLIPSTVSAAWQEGPEIFEYYKGKIDNIT